MVENKRLKSLDILKGVAILMVILVHYNLSFSCGIKALEFCKMGCQIFFMLSGFGCAISLSNKTKEKSFISSTKEFYFSRLKAIAPAYWFMLIFIYLINTVIIQIIGHPLYIGSNRNIFDILCNVFLVHGLVPSAINSVIPGGWYIGTTMLLYLIAPFLFFIFNKFKQKSLVCVVTSLLSFLSLVLLSIVFPSPNNSWLDNGCFGYCSVLAQYPCFCLGMLLYFQKQQDKVKNKNLSFLIGLVLFIGSILLYFNPITKYSFIILVALVGLSAYFILNSMIEFEKSNTFSNFFAPIIKLGKKSLYIFLVHFFFATNFVDGIIKTVGFLGINADNYVSFLILFPIVTLISYYFGCGLERIVKAITNALLKHKHSFKKTA